MSNGSCGICVEVSLCAVEGQVVAVERCKSNTNGKKMHQAAKIYSDMLNDEFLSKNHFGHCIAASESSMLLTLLLEFQINVVT